MRIRGFWTLVLSGVVAAACGPLPGQSPASSVLEAAARRAAERGQAGAGPKLLAAPDYLAGKTVLFDEHVEGSGPLAEALAREASQALVESGYLLVRDANRPHDFDVHLGVAASGDAAAYRMRVEYDGTTVDQLALVDGTPRNGAVNLVNQLAMSPRMHALAERKGWASAVAVAAAAPAPPSPAPSSPAPSASPRPTTLAAAASEDQFLPGAPQPTAYVLAIGVEHYKTLPAPVGARADAERFARMAERSLGVPPSHVRLVVDDEATKGTIERHIEWLKATVPSGGRVYFYFSGHGAPDPTSGTSHLVPIDGDPQYLAQTSLQVSDVLARLSQSKAKDTLAIVDSCFSGAGGRSVLPPGARALTRVKAEPVTGRIAFLSAASGSEISGPAPGSSAGLFTQYVLAGLGSGGADSDGDGQVSLQELADFVRTRVTREARKDNRDQTPTLVASRQVGSPSSFMVAWGFPAK